jgi:hypothetical protein
MAPLKKTRRAAGSDEPVDEGASAAKKIAGVLALIATKGMETDDAALKLDAIGFTAKEISSLLNVGPNYVNVARHRKNSGGKNKTRKKRAP